MKKLITLLFSTLSFSQDFEIEDKRGSNNSSGGIFDNGQGNQQGNGNGGNGHHYGWETPTASIDNEIFIIVSILGISIYVSKIIKYENNA